MSVGPMSVTAMPSHGEVIIGRDVAGRVLRISGHPESDRVVLSIWQGSTCVSTLRLASEDIPTLVSALVSTVLPEQRPAVVEAAHRASLPERLVELGRRGGQTATSFLDRIFSPPEH